MAAARLRMWARVLLEEADALIDVLHVPVDGRHRDAGEVVREEAAGSVVVADCILYSDNRLWVICRRVFIHPPRLNGYARAGDRTKSRSRPSVQPRPPG